MSNNIDYKNFDKDFFNEEYEDIIDFFDDMLYIAQTNGDKLYNLYEDSIKCSVLKYVNSESKPENIIN
jgi:hypothetical protein